MTLEIDIRKTPAPTPKPDPRDLGFGRYFTDHIFRMDYTGDRGWHDARIVPYGALGLEPAAAALHYGQCVFDGHKVFRTADGRVQAFRLDDHCRRLNASAVRLRMPTIELDLLRESFAELVRVERDWVPAGEGTALYARPTMIASEPFLGVRAADGYTYFVLLTPVGSYYAEGHEPIKIWVEMEQVRAAPGGLGAAKTGANYAASLFAAARAQAQGFHQVLWLDALEHRYLEEVGTMNLFLRIGDEVVTPPLDGTILPGVTRDSALVLLRDWGVPVSERRISIDEVRVAHRRGELHEVFGTGTAAVISPVGALGFPDGVLEVADGKPGAVARRLYDALTGIQYGRLPDRFRWMTLLA